MATTENLELFKALRNGDVLGLTQALEFGANPNFIYKLEDGAPMPLHEAAKIKDESIGAACTKLLLERGAMTDIKNVSTKNTPLHEGKNSYFFRFF